MKRPTRIDTVRGKVVPLISKEAQSLRRQFKEAAPKLTKRLDALIIKAAKRKAVAGKLVELNLMDTGRTIKVGPSAVSPASKPLGSKAYKRELAEAKPEPTKKQRPKKPEPRKVDVISAIEEAMSEIETLREEMESWQGNMESASMEQVPKYEEVSECVQELEQLEEPGNLGDCNGLRSLTIDIQDPSPRKRGYSRSERMSHALAILADANAAIEELKDQMEDLFSSVDEIVSNGENISFPKMF